MEEPYSSTIQNQVKPTIHQTAPKKQSLMALQRDSLDREISGYKHDLSS